MKVLQLSSSFEPMNFLSFKKAIKLVIKGKAEVISEWKDKEGKFVRLAFGRGFMAYPAIIRMKYYTPRHIKRIRFNRAQIFKRDDNTCQYCGQIFKTHELTIDHVFPKDLGGKNGWENCVTACGPCNAKKANKTPKMAGMKLLKKPKKPIRLVWQEYNSMLLKHEDWEHYILSNKY